MKLFMIICAIVFSIITSYLAFKDFLRIEDAIEVERYVKTYCADRRKLPSLREVSNKFEFFKKENGWYYFLNFSNNEVSIQYPMNLPLPGAPGRMKLSEFAPVIYANSIRIACP